MQQILILGGGAAGLAAALAAAQTAEGRAHITVLDKNAKMGKKLLATGNGRCNLDNRDITPERYFTSSPKALRRLLSAVDEAAPLAWFENLGLYPRTDEAGRVYPYSNQAADVLAGMGLTISDLVRITLTKVAREKALPFDLREPNQLTIQSIKNSEAGVDVHKAKDADDLFDKLGI